MAVAHGACPCAVPLPNPSVDTHQSADKEPYSPPGPRPRLPWLVLGQNLPDERAKRGNGIGSTTLLLEWEGIAPCAIPPAHRPLTVQGLVSWGVCRGLVGWNERPARDWPSRFLLCCCWLGFLLGIPRCRPSPTPPMPAVPRPSRCGPSPDLPAAVRSPNPTAALPLVMSTPWHSPDHPLVSAFIPQRIPKVVCCAHGDGTVAV